MRRPACLAIERKIRSARKLLSSSHCGSLLGLLAPPARRRETASECRLQLPRGCVAGSSAVRGLLALACKLRVTTWQARASVFARGEPMSHLDGVGKQKDVDFTSNFPFRTTSLVGFLRFAY